MLKINISHQGKPVVILFIWSLLFYSCGQISSKNEYLDGEFWRNQGLTSVIPFWQQHVLDSAKGAYFLNLSREGNPLPPFDKHPAMIGRQIYGFSCAYLLSGNETYLQSAKEGAEYLLDHAWDKNYGGWYDLLDEDGNAKVSTKTVPNELYTNVGLAEYYFVTGDKQALEKVMESVRLRQTYARDDVYGGYFQALNRDLSVADSSKSKHSHYGYTSSLLLNLMLFTGEKEIGSFAEELMNISIAKMTDSPYGWVNGFPSPNNLQWMPNRRILMDREVISAGAQLTACFSLMRLSEITGIKQYEDMGKKLAIQVMNSAYDPVRGTWFDMIYGDQPSFPADTSIVWWWLQSYGMFSMIHLYHLTRDDSYLESFSRMASVWTEYFIDHEYGGAYIGITPSGEAKNKEKASAWKSSYHEMETSLLNYLYLNLYVNRKQVTFYFNITEAVEGEKHFVSLAEDPSVRISSVTINGKRWDSFDTEGRSVTLPAGKNLKMAVTLKPGK
ncbi:MAG TPA: AGE family epimerase/isomerase [Bacteroidales bacterium]|nr:AGE family epimerase/isomerase [Bacteroidales bacterium]